MGKGFRKRGVVGRGKLVGPFKVEWSIVGKVERKTRSHGGKNGKEEKAGEDESQRKGSSFSSEKKTDDEKELERRMRNGDE